MNIWSFWRNNEWVQCYYPSRFQAKVKLLKARRQWHYKQVRNVCR